ncbi:MAG: MaoC family dehydratase N-terminal domain-containing protein [Candidatus Melainabacteria bacterium]|nr:MaoC family dehydratase N-terminal domain-containing protein [Candidatus Melainabacteria bacterium]
MVIDQKFIGKTYPDLVYQIAKEKLKEFVLATKADQEKFAEITPPTFPVVYMHDLLWTVLFDPELKLNLAKLVHGEQDFVYHKPTRVGDTITTKSRIEKIFSKSVHDFVVMVSESYNQNDELVCTSTWTFIIRGGNDKDFSLQEKLVVKLMSLLPPCPNAKAKRMAAMQELRTLTGADIALDRALQDLAHHSGDEYKVFIDKYMPQVYAGASGDFNVIHLDESFGRQVGLGGYILHGMATMALGVNYFMKEKAADSIKRYRARFSDVVKPMDTLTYSGSQDGDKFSFVAKNQAGKEVLGAGLVEFA